MIVRTLAETVDTDRHVKTDLWDSVRLLLAKDGMGFSLHLTTVFAGSEIRMQYKHHLEGVYCVSGKAELEDVASGERHPIGPGVMYALDKNDQHVMRAEEDTVFVCVFNPAITGSEVHRSDGSYAPPE